MASVAVVVLGAMVIAASIAALTYAVRPRRSLRPLSTSMLVPDDEAIQDFRKHVHEAVVRRSIVFWSESCIDTTLFYHDSRGTLEELSFLRGCETKEDLVRVMPWSSSEGFQLSYGLATLEPYETEAILNKFWAPRMGAFRQRSDLLASTSATASAIQMLLELTKYDGRLREKKVALEGALLRFPEWTKGSRDFIEWSIDDATGMISDIPGETPSISSNHCGWISLRDLDVAGTLFRKRQLSNKFTKALRAYLVGGNGWQAFADSPGGEPSICASHHALAGIAATDNGDVILDNLALDWSKLFKFVTLCRKDGGFAPHIGEESTVVHTRYALALLRSVVSHQSFSGDAGALLTEFGISPEAIVAFLDSLWTPFGSRLSKSSSPSMYSTRATLLALKYLELFRIGGFFTAKPSYLGATSNLLSKIQREFEAVASSYSVKDGIHGFPRVTEIVRSPSDLVART